MLTISRLIKQVRDKHFEATSFSDEFSQVFDSIRREKMGLTQRAYGSLKKTVTSQMMLYRNTKAMLQYSRWIFQEIL